MAAFGKPPFGMIAFMAKNVEIKASAPRFDDLNKRAMKLAGGPGEVLLQEDIFFQAERGRLKLRIFSPDSAELISYERPDQEGPKTSNYVIYKTERPDELREVLSASLPPRGVVRKCRRLYKIGPTRVHLDEVDGLGRFVELEVVLKEGQSEDQGRQIADELMKHLDIRPEDLIDRAYIDLLQDLAEAT